MELKEIKQYINSINKELFTPSDNLIENFVLDDLEIPFYLNWKFDYVRLKEIHSEIINHLYTLKTLIHKKKSDALIYKLLKLKLITDNLIQSHTEDKKTNGASHFKNENIESSENQRINTLPIHSDHKFHKTILIKKIYSFLVKENYLTKGSNNRRLFVSLFFEKNMTGSDDYIYWNGTDSSLRAFLTSLIDEKLISYNLSLINELAYSCFMNLDSKGNFKKIVKSNFKSYPKKADFENQVKKYKSDLEKIFKN